ncbi:MAG: transposase [Proteobacteria bacterium]|nr:transposase [Pseudomonadota bacterium]
MTCPPHQSAKGRGRTLTPDLNLIEMLFSKLKHGLRAAAKSTQDALYDAIVDLLPTVKPAECQNFFDKAGYART